MNFEWDEVKRESNLKKHGFDFADAKLVFSGTIFTLVDDRFEYEEDRFITLGILRGEIAVIAHTEWKETVRVISMLKATKNEKKIFYQELPDGLETN